MKHNDNLVPCELSTTSASQGHTGNWCHLYLSEHEIMEEIWSLWGHVFQQPHELVSTHPQQGKPRVLWWKCIYWHGIHITMTSVSLLCTTTLFTCMYSKLYKMCSITLVLAFCGCFEVLLSNSCWSTGRVFLLSENPPDKRTLIFPRSLAFDHMQRNSSSRALFCEWFQKSLNEGVGIWATSSKIF